MSPKCLGFPELAAKERRITRAIPPHSLQTTLHQEDMASLSLSIREWLNLF